VVELVQPAVVTAVVKRDQHRHVVVARPRARHGQHGQPIACLEGAHQREDQVAVVLVDDKFPDKERADLFDLVRRLHPDARRTLLVDWGAWADRGSAQAILHAMAVGHINYYVLKPWIQRDELFHRTVAEFVQEWSRSAVSNLREVVVVAEPVSDLEERLRKSEIKKRQLERRIDDLLGHR